MIKRKDLFHLLLLNVVKITNSQFSDGAGGEGQDQCEGYSMKADKSVPKPSFHPGITQKLICK